jgi:hypothetical protein
MFSATQAVGADIDHFFNLQFFHSQKMFKPNKNMRKI